jgi:hypothetical protein
LVLEHSLPNRPTENGEEPKMLSPLNGNARQLAKNAQLPKNHQSIMVI